ncbi:hypothetical protein N752_26445 [Desulforamulus aquiferis]|nr:bifunctional precorrin-2 dehydrogenase/sirohydrochlorin ferrochelatase [Desulforamulus aquiferis]RYD01995.1 hypothetical protein N752_26445 [Desulforamulus aquiferis]
MSNLYPIFLDLGNKPCLVIGGGLVAERKLEALLACQANVILVSPRVTPHIKDWSEQGKLMLVRRNYQRKDLQGVCLVFAATDSQEVNNQISKDCVELNLPVNVVNDPDKGTFQVPSVVRRGKLTIAVSTGGSSPLLAAKIRRQLEVQYGQEYAEFIELLSDVRRQVLSNVDDIAQRKAIFNDLVESDILELLKMKSMTR